jgi:hypothetical protein
MNLNFVPYLPNITFDLHVRLKWNLRSLSKTAHRNKNYVAVYIRTCGPVFRFVSSSVCGLFDRRSEPVFVAQKQFRYLVTV